MWCGVVFKGMGEHVVCGQSMVGERVVCCQCMDVSEMWCGVVGCGVDPSLLSIRVSLLSISAYVAVHLHC